MYSLVKIMGWWIASCHGHPEILEGVEAGGGLRGFLALFGHFLDFFGDGFEASEEDLEYGDELAAVE